MKQYIENFIEMMAVERASSRNTQYAYSKDLQYFCKYLEGRKINFMRVDQEIIREYLKYINKKSNHEDLTDLLKILRNRNSK